jgi:hypothetical protein
MPVNVRPPVVVPPHDLDRLSTLLERQPAGDGRLLQLRPIDVVGRPRRVKEAASWTS